MKNPFKNLKNFINERGILGIVLWIIKKLYFIISYILGGTLRINQIQVKLNKSNAKKQKDYDMEILIWFYTEWLKDKNSRKKIELQKKQQFYQWLEENYLFHIKKKKKNRNEYFANAKKHGVYEAISRGGNWLYLTVSIGITAITSFTLKESILTAINQFISSTNMNLIFKPIVSFLIILVIACFIIFISYGFFATINIHYRKKMEDIQQKKETWVRHTEALYAYQYEMINYIFNSKEYTQCVTFQEKELMLMNRIITVWQNNGMRFQSNMKKAKE